MDNYEGVNQKFNIEYSEPQESLEKTQQGLSEIERDLIELRRELKKGEDELEKTKATNEFARQEGSMEFSEDYTKSIESKIEATRRMIKDFENLKNQAEALIARSRAIDARLTKKALSHKQDKLS